MNPPQDDKDTPAVRRPTAERRQQIYEEEKIRPDRVEQEARTFAKKTGVIASVYLVGCLLIYFGISNAVIDFWSTHTWELKPESDVFESLVYAVLTLIRPFVVVVVMFWVVAIPPGIVFGLWCGGAHIVSFVKRLVNRDND